MSGILSLLAVFLDVMKLVLMIENSPILKFILAKLLII